MSVVRGSVSASLAALVLVCSSSAQANPQLARPMPRPAPAVRTTPAYEYAEPAPEAAPRTATRPQEAPFQGLRLPTPVAGATVRQSATARVSPAGPMPAPMPRALPEARTQVAPDGSPVRISGSGGSLTPEARAITAPRVIPFAVPAAYDNSGQNRAQQQPRVGQPRPQARPQAQAQTQTATEQALDLNPEQQTFIQDRLGQRVIQGLQQIQSYQLRNQVAYQVLTLTSTMAEVDRALAADAAETLTDAARYARLVILGTNTQALARCLATYPQTVLQRMGQTLIDPALKTAVRHRYATQTEAQTAVRRALVDSMSRAMNVSVEQAQQSYQTLKQAPCNNFADLGM